MPQLLTKNFPSSTQLRPVNSSGLQIQLNFLLSSSQWNFRFQQGIKRFADIVLSGLGILMILPLLTTIALAVKLTSRGPVLYNSDRIGQGFESFKMFKFRTMAENADALRDQLRDQADLDQNLFKMKADPRVTPLGKFLRAYSLDELPQLFNVLLGDMSLVGPRPLPPDESDNFKEPYTLRFSVPPGITGLWQVSGRSGLNFQQLCELDMGYASSWNLFSDIKILLKTVPVVLGKDGAY